MDEKYIRQELDKLFPEPKCELDYRTPFELLVAVILSAQCTDKRVCLVTKHLFEKYKSPADLANADRTELEKEIHSCGFYRAKAAHLISMSKDLVEKFDGQVPQDFDSLTSLAGVGRKTANVVIGEAFGQPAVAVDTHVLRVSNRLGLTNSSDPAVCEEQLKKYFPRESWSKLHLQLVHFGRYKCKAIKPDCEGCPFASACTEKQKTPKI